ncbi:BREX-1 system adenine-specific DNA-methyltransferase PglX [Rhizobium sp. R339]|uniref:BREX-1 system adenine-specific DNA-methyltransferase PglX n=1 Tax=Rhizobium sp. R339 TaxID=1764273 RepID=UPI001FD8B8B6|nr:BREX-1 system adenine-specific DNA-methyltransferase PglX [Rhizobium sp. R339]
MKKFAQAARTSLIKQVSARLEFVLAEGSVARREASAAVKELEKEIASAGREQIVEKVAYTWFNRFTALRFMDANGHTTIKAVTPAEGQTRPELLAEAAAGHLEDAMSKAAREEVAALLDGRRTSQDPQGEAYRFLLVHVCNQWHGAMPYLFEKIDDYSELLMPEDLLSQTSVLADLRKVMTDEACQDVEIIGWLYQFYISEKKDQVFAGLKKNQKITAENIPAATQLFTPHWIVRYLVENSLGRLWLLNRPGSRLSEKMDYYIEPEEPGTDFLRISKPEEIKICDPACGSGHMLTYAFDLLNAIYEEEGYEATEIPGLILKHNLTGLEIDDRAGALAAFALSMKAAAKLGRRRFLRMEVKPDIVVLQNVTFTPAEMTDVSAVVGRDLFTDELRETLTQFSQAKNFGSLIVPRLRDPAETLRVVEARDFGSDLLLKEVQARVLALLRMAVALSPKYHVVVANPPYMGGKGMNGRLGDFAKAKFPDSKSDLFAMFMERALALALPAGMTAMINMHSWMFLSSFEKLRGKILSKATILTMAHLGERAFDSIGGAVVSTTAFVLRASSEVSHKGEYVRLIDGRSEAAKSKLLMQAAKNSLPELVHRTSSEKYFTVPGNPITYWLSDDTFKLFRDSKKLADIFKPKVGLNTTDNGQFLRLWQEVSQKKAGYGFPSSEEAKNSGLKWFPYNKGGSYRRWYGNFDYFLNWGNDGQDIKSAIANDPAKQAGGRVVNEDCYFLPSLSWSLAGAKTFSVRFSPKGAVFDVGGSSIFPDRGTAMCLSAYLCSSVSNYFMAAMNPTFNFQAGNVAALPILPEALSSNAAASKANGLIEAHKSDWDAYESSWDFTTLPLLSPDHRAKTLEATYIRLRAHWQGMTEDMQRLEEENNRIFIDAYGLQDELTPEVPIEEITLTCNPAYRYGVKVSEEERETRLRAETIAEFLHYAVGCMFGRYSLDAPGLILANEGETLADYIARIPEPNFMPDEDNVIPVVDGEWFSDDIVERFRKFMRVTFGEEKLHENLAFVENSLGKDIRRWFTRDFFDYHVRRYKKRPIYWMFSSPKGSFNALVYMHRYRPDTVSIVLNDYLRAFITKLQGHLAVQERLELDASAAPSQRAKAQKEILATRKIIDELSEWERDVIYPLAQQRIEIDLDDGVKANYPKFGTALKKIAGLEAPDE